MPPPLIVPAARERLAIRRAIVVDKLRRAVLPAMRAHDVDAWITIDRENRADPLHEDFGGPCCGAAAASLFFDRGVDGLEAIFIGPAQPVDSPVHHAFDVTAGPATTLKEVHRLVADAVRRRAPRRIGVNSSPTSGAADGLSTALERVVRESLGADMAERLVSAEPVAHVFRARRTSLETEWYTKLQRWTSRLQEEALASVVPGVSTALDLACHFEDSARAIGLELVADHGRYPLIVWFGDRLDMPGVTSFGPDRPLRPGATDLRDFLLRSGDLVTVDGGLRFLGLASDMKRTAYVLPAGVSAPPADLQRAWRQTLDVADSYARRMVPGATGEEVFTGLMAELDGLGHEPAAPPRISIDRCGVTVYGHSVGNAVHDLGPRIGANATAGSRFELQPGEWVSIEFHLVTPAAGAPGGAWLTRFEQTAQVADGGATWLMPPPEALLVIDAARVGGSRVGGLR